ncbi:MAG: CPBP family intramembrane glutamic endopeptidase [Bryobacteraceae bacterium]
MEPSISYFSQLNAAGQEVVQGNYQAAARIFDLTKQGQCPEEVSELAEVLGLMTVKVAAREQGLEKALNEVNRKNAALEVAAKLRSEFSMVFSGTVIWLSLYAMVLAYIQNVAHVALQPKSMSTMFMNLGLCVALTVMMVTFLRAHHYPSSTFGFTLANWKRAVGESLLVCIPALGLLALFKVYLVNTDPAYAGMKIIEWGTWESWPFFLLYIFVTFFQELSCRGFQQTCVERLLAGKQQTVAVLLCAAQFGVVHLHYSFRLGMMSFIGAALFGFLYARHRTIAGITVAHYVLGQFIFGPLQLVR